MVTCRKCKSNRWKVFEVKRRELPINSPETVRLECIECENEEYAFYKNGRILVSGSTANYRGFIPLKCLCGSNEWEILQGEIICRVCKKRFYLYTGIKISKKTSPPKKVGDYWG